MVLFTPPPQFQPPPVLNFFTNSYGNVLQQPTRDIAITYPACYIGPFKAEYKYVYYFTTKYILLWGKIILTGKAVSGYRP